MAEREPLDENAAWAEIVAAYDEQTADPERDRPLSGTRAREEPDDRTEPDGTDADDFREPDGDTLIKPRPTDPDLPVNSITGFTAGSSAGPSAGTGPRDWEPPPSEEEEHFVPPEPPPLPQADATTKFAWTAVLGGPLLLVGAVIFQQPMTWWILTLGIGGFLGGFGTLVFRMRDDDDDDFADPGSGAVV